jgi:hypothetical protein
MASLAQPINGNQSFSPNQSQQHVVDALASAYDDAMRDYNTLQLNMEKQLQQKADSLFALAQQHAGLLKEHAAAKKQTEEAIQQVEQLRSQLNTAKQTVDALREKLLAAQADGHTLRADLKNAFLEKEDFQRSVTALEGRLSAQLDLSIKLQKQVDAVQKLPQLRQAFKALRVEIQRIHRLRNWQVLGMLGRITAIYTVGIVGGVLVGGPVGLVAGAGAAQAKILSDMKPGEDPRDIEDRNRWNNFENLRYEILEIQSGLTKEAFCAKPEADRVWLLAHHELTY